MTWLWECIWGVSEKKPKKIRKNYYERYVYGKRIPACIKLRLIDWSEWPDRAVFFYKLDFWLYQATVRYYFFFEKDFLHPLDFLVYAYFIDQPGLIHMW